MSKERTSSSQNLRKLTAPVWIYFNVFWNVLVMKHVGNYLYFNFFLYLPWIRVLTWGVKMVYSRDLSRPRFPSIKWSSWPCPHDLHCHLIFLARQAGPGSWSRPTWEGPLEAQRWKEGAVPLLTMVRKTDFEKNQLKGVSIKLKINRQNWIPNPWRWGKEKKSRCKTHMKDNKKTKKKKER